jgi:hypothetical protein
VGADRGSLTGLAAARALAECAEDELAALHAGDLDRFEDLAARREALVAAMPERLPPEARPELEAALAIQQAVSARLAELRDEVAAELRGVAHGRRAASGYAYAAGPDAPAAGGIDAVG